MQYQILKIGEYKGEDRRYVSFLLLGASIGVADVMHCIIGNTRLLSSQISYVKGVYPGTVQGMHCNNTCGEQVSQNLSTRLQAHLVHAFPTFCMKHEVIMAICCIPRVTALI